MATDNQTRRRLVGYCRVSTDNQKEEGTIELQERALQEYAEANGVDLVRVFTDEAVSGSKDLERRPALSELFSFLETAADVSGVLVFKLDRLARDLYIQEHLIKKLEAIGKVLLSIKEPNLESSDPMRKAFRQFMGIVSELEKAFIAMRLSGGRINKARKGGYAGGAPGLGYKVKNKELTVDEGQAETVRRIFALRKKDGRSLHDIARTLNAENVPTARGGKWYAGTVRYILENAVYSGTLAYSGQSTTRSDLALVMA